MKIGNISLTWLGHDTFLIEGEKVIYTDPFVLPSTPKKADLILITHDHYDHCVPEKVKQIQKSDTVIVTTPDCAKKLSGDIRTIRPGQNITIGDIAIKAVPAYNTGKQFHPKSSGWVGFVFIVSKTTFYIAGDTDFIPEMKGLKPDVAMLPIGGKFTMDIEQAIQAALAIEPKIVIPMHYDTFGGIEADPQEFKEKLNAKNPGIRVEIL
jgi:L-ascorbate metabolism protein UlaG (beta-lactamase superfamily)